MYASADPQIPHGIAPVFTGYNLINGDCLYYPERRNWKCITYLITLRNFDIPFLSPLLYIFDNIMVAAY